jgi:DNA repair exonuclease SbcCD ATPase subunit
MTLRRVTRIELEDWRSWQGLKTLEDLPSGLVVLAGPNALGKTGLWEAIVAGLLDRHWGRHTDRLRPAGTKGVLPRVKLEFRCGAGRFRVEKHFGSSRDRARFEEFAGEAWVLRDQGEDAWSHCRREVLGIDGTAPNRGGPEKALHDTLMEVLLTPQGGLTAAPPAPEAISAAVTDRAAADTATRIGRLLAEASRQADEFWVGQRNRPRKGTVLQVGQDRLAAIEEEMLPLEGRAEEIQDRVARLTRASEMLSDRDEADAQNARATALRAEAKAHREARETARRKEEASRKELDAAASLLEDRTNRVKAVEDAREALGAAEERAETAARSLKRLEEDRRREAGRRDGLDTAVRQLREWAAYEQRDAELELLGMELSAVRQRIATVETEEEAIGKLQAERDSLLLPTGAEWKEWDDLRQRHDQAEGRLQAGAWSVEGNVPGGLRLTVDGEEVEGDSVDRKVAREVVLSDGSDRALRVGAPPGGAEKLASVTEEVRPFFARFGVKDITELRTRNEYVKEELSRELALARQRLEGALDRGSKTDLLRRELEIQGRLKSVDAERAPETERPAGSPDQWALFLEQQVSELDVSRKRVEELGTEYGAVQAQERDAAEALKRAAQDLDVARAALERHRSDHGADEEVRSEARVREQGHERLREAWRKLEEARPMAEDAREERAERLSSGLREILRKQEEVQRLETEIETLRRGDPEAGLARLSSEHAELAARVRQEETKANALRLLESSLAAEKERVALAIGGPVRERIQGWVRYLLQDDSEVVVDDRGRPTVLRSPAGQDVPFEDQSFGTREQVAVLYRLAVADLVAQESGAGVCLMLDDPFGHTDRGRRARMLGILSSEAEKRGHQILVFTCRPEDFTGVGHHVSLPS